MAIRVRAIGPLTIETDRGERAGTELGGARERRLLAILAHAPGTVVPRERIIEELWDRAPRDPAAALDTAISLLRRALGPDATALSTHRPGYLLDCITDLDELDRAVREERWEAALELLGEELLAGEPSTDWVDRQRDQLRSRRVEVLVRAAAVAARRGDDPLAAARYADAARLEPLREDAQRGLVAALARTGRAAEALRAYEHCRRVLREELGVDPSPETAAVYEQVLAGMAPPDPLAPAPTPAGAGSIPFMGRRSQLAALAASPEGPRVRAVLGEPGIGKTRLLEEVTAALEQRTIRWARCFRLVAPVPYAVLGELVPDLSTEGVRSDLPPEALAVALAAAWRDRLREDPSVLVIDDLQWADEPSLVVLGLVLRDPPADLLVLASARDTELAPDKAAAQLLELASTLGIAEVTTLGPLTLDELAAGGYDRHDWERSGGHPLLLAELARGGSAQDLAGLVVGRAVAAGADATELLRAAAVLDRPAPLAQLARLAQLSVPAARAVAGELAVAGLLVEAGGEWRPRHDVVAELVRDDLGAGARRGWHRRVLAELETQGAPPAALAHHALGAGDPAACLAHSLDAGDRALGAFANREAVDHYWRALETLDSEDPVRLEPVADRDGLRRRAVLGAARALIVLGRTWEARDLLEGLPSGTGAEEVERLLLVADCAWAEWKPSRAIAPAEAALALARDLGDEDLEGRSHAFIANPYGSLGELTRADGHVEAALAIAARRRHPPPATVLYRRALIQHQHGSEHDALESLDRCRQLALEQHDERTLVFERIVRAWALGALGRYGEALASLDEVSSIGRGEEALVRSRIPNTRASFLADLGLVAEALDADEESLEITRGQLGGAILEPQIHTLLNLATDHLRLDDPDRAAACLAEAEELLGDAEYARFRMLSRLHWVQGLLRLAGDERDEAFEEADRVGELATRYGAPRYEVRAGLLRGMALGRSSRAREVEEATVALRAAARTAERCGFAALAVDAHRLLGALGSDHHVRRAERIRAGIVASVQHTHLAERLR